MKGDRGTKVGLEIDTFRASLVFGNALNSNGFGALLAVARPLARARASCRSDSRQ